MPCCLVWVCINSENVMNYFFLKIQLNCREGGEAFVIKGKYSNRKIRDY